MTIARKSLKEWLRDLTVHLLLAEEDIQGLKVYSDAETPVGTWVDGKTIYRKVLSGTSTSGSTSVSISSLNIGNIIRGNIIIHNSSNNSWVFDSYVQNSSTDWFNWYVSSDFSTLYLRSGSSYAFGPYYIILEYTKASS